MLEIHAVTRRYGRRPVLGGVSLQVARGEVACLLGPNGAGKSTLLAIVAGALPPTGGLVLWDGRPLAEARRGAGCLVGYAPQEVALYPGLTVKENLALWAHLYGVPRAQASARSRELAHRLGLVPFMDARVEHLSGGTRRKVHLAVALLPDPPILALDEPTAGVDVGTCREIVRFIRERAQEGRVVLYTTHNYSEVEEVCDRLCLLHQGTLRFCGSLAEARRQAGPGLPLAEVCARLAGW